MLHKFNINVIVAVILSPKLGLYDLCNPRHIDLGVYFRMQISLSTISRKISISRHMLLLKLYINE